MHKISIEENFDNQRNIIFDKDKVDHILKDLNNESFFLLNNDNIEGYHNFMEKLSTSINKFSMKVV